jgi:hypothetical protein
MCALGGRTTAAVTLSFYSICNSNAGLLLSLQNQALSDTGCKIHASLNSPLYTGGTDGLYNPENHEIYLGFDKIPDCTQLHILFAGLTSPSGAGLPALF